MEDHLGIVAPSRILRQWTDDDRGKAPKEADDGKSQTHKWRLPHEQHQPIWSGMQRIARHEPSLHGQGIDWIRGLGHGHGLLGAEGYGYEGKDDASIPQCGTRPVTLPNIIPREA